MNGINDLLIKSIEKTHKQLEDNQVTITENNVVVTVNATPRILSLDFDKNINPELVLEAINNAFSKVKLSLLDTAISELEVK